MAQCQWGVRLFVLSIYVEELFVISVTREAPTCHCNCRRYVSSCQTSLSLIPAADFIQNFGYISIVPLMKSFINSVYQFTDKTDLIKVEFTEFRPDLPPFYIQKFDVIFHTSLYASNSFWKASLFNTLPPPQHPTQKKILLLCCNFFRY